MGSVCLRSLQVLHSILQSAHHCSQVNPPLEALILHDLGLKDGDMRILLTLMYE